MIYTTSEREKITHIIQHYNEKLIALQELGLQVRLQHGTYRSLQHSLESR
jgi:hypothetical protein